jgi:dUTP pyrophosphatase
LIFLLGYKDFDMKFYLLTKNATIPKRATSGAAGFDLFPLGPNEIILPGRRVVVPTGVACEIDPGWYGRIAPRSGMAVRHGINVLAGVVDSDYRGEIKVVLHNTSHQDYMVSDRACAQIIFERCWDGEPDIISDDYAIMQDDLAAATERGSKGFGSTDMPIGECDPITCPKCSRHWPPDSEQGICAELYKKCFGCSAPEITKEQLYTIQQLVKERTNAV